MLMILPPVSQTTFQQSILQYQTKAIVLKESIRLPILLILPVLLFKLTAMIQQTLQPVVLPTLQLTQRRYK